MRYHFLAGQTPLDEQEKRDLIPSIVTREDLDAFEQANILEARAWLMRKSVLARQEVFSEVFLRNLHKRMFGHVWKWAGSFRRTNKNIGVEYYQIPAELRHLLDDARYLLDHQTYPTCDLAVIIHHRLVKIHLFPNGNGRHARMCADAIVAKFGGESLTWGDIVSVTKPDETRRRYIAALREADGGDYDALLAFARS